MTTLNTKGMKYNVLPRCYIFSEHPIGLTTYATMGIFLFFLILLPSISEIVSIKNLKDLTQKPPIMPIIKIVLTPYLFCTIGKSAKIEPYLYLWTHQQNSEQFAISKSEIITNILSDNCQFMGYIYTPTSNRNIHKTCIKIPLTNIEYDKIFAHLRNNREHEEKCMNPDVTIKE